MSGYKVYLSGDLQFEEDSVMILYLDGHCLALTKEADEKEIMVRFFDAKIQNWGAGVSLREFRMSLQEAEERLQKQLNSSTNS